jgi:hypothetical protein
MCSQVAIINGCNMPLSIPKREIEERRVVYYWSFTGCPQRSLW